VAKIIVTVDLGHFRAYRVTYDPLGRPVTDLIESYDSIEGHGRLSEKLSDTAGRLLRGGGKRDVAKGYGEPHHLESEIRKKLIRMIALDINALIKSEACEGWYLAAGEKISEELINKLEPEVKSRLLRNITADLTTIPVSEIVSHFK